MNKIIFRIEINKKHETYNNIVRHFMNNNEYPLPEMRKFRRPAKLFMADLLLWNEAFFKNVGKAAFIIQEGKTKNNRICHIIFKNQDLLIIESDDKFSFEMDNTHIINTK